MHIINRYLRCHSDLFQIRRCVATGKQTIHKKYSTLLYCQWGILKLSRFSRFPCQFVFNYDFFLFIVNDEGIRLREIKIITARVLYNFIYNSWETRLANVMYGLDLYFRHFPLLTDFWCIGRIVSFNNFLIRSF